MDQGHRSAFGSPPGGLTDVMFVGDEVRLEVGFAAARARLANLIHGNPLKDASQEAYSGAITGLEWVGPLGSAPGVSRLVEVHSGIWWTTACGAS